MVQSIRQQPIRLTLKMRQVEKQFDLILEEDLKHLISHSTQYELAEKWGVTRSTVGLWLEIFGVKLYTIGIVADEKITIKRLPDDIIKEQIIMNDYEEVRDEDKNK